MHTVLVPTDFSDNAFNALKYACQVFKYEACKIFILHAYTVDTHSKDALDADYFGTLKETTMINSEKKLKKVLTKIKEYSPNPQHNYQIVSGLGTLADVTNFWVDKENIDIVVMGTRGETNDRTLTFGSNTLEIMKYEHCPVLAIPEGYEYRAPREVLFPTDFGVTFKRRELKLLGNISASFRSTVTFFYINPDKEMTHIQEDNKLFLKGSLLQPKLLFERTPETDKTLAITKYIFRKEFDMLVMVNTRQSYFDEVLPQPHSTLSKIGLQVKIPFLVLQNIAR